MMYSGETLSQGLGGHRICQCLLQHGLAEGEFMALALARSLGTFLFKMCHPLLPLTLHTLTHEVLAGRRRGAGLHVPERLHRARAP